MSNKIKDGVGHWLTQNIVRQIFYSALSATELGRELLYLCLDARDLGKELKEYFASVFTKWKDMEDNKFEIKKEKVLGLLKSIKVDKTLPDDIYSGLLREARENIAGASIKIILFSLVGELESS